jgi:GYF domain 2
MVSSRLNGYPDSIFSFHQKKNKWNFKDPPTKIPLSDKIMRFSMEPSLLLKNLYTTLLISLITGSICAWQAKKSGKDGLKWFLIGAVFGLFGLYFLYLAPKKKKVEDQEQPPAKEPPKELPFAGKFWYYLDEEEQQIGPMSFEALKSALNQNKISLQTYVWNEDFEEWKSAEEIEELSGSIVTSLP